MAAGAARRLRAAAAALVLLASANARAADLSVAVLGWPEALAPDVLESFSRETGIAVSLDANDDPDAIARLIAKRAAGIDLVLLPADVAARLRQDGHLRALGSTAPGLLPGIAQALRVYDGDGLVLRPLVWDITGFGLNTRGAGPALGAAPAALSWSQLLRGDLAARLRGCGIGWPDAAGDSAALALRALGLDPASTRPADLTRAIDLLMRVRGAVRRIVSPEDVSGLASGDLCLQVAAGRDVERAAQLSRAAGGDVPVTFVTPSDGGLLHLDVMAVPADAPHPDLATKLVDFLSRPQIAARIAAYNLARSPTSKDHADLAAAGTALTLPPRDSRQLQPLDRLWARFKASR